jgi:glycosyltransferase involved in cell wall biosynthesis
MRILMLSDHCCIRVIKEGTALEEDGHEITYMHRRIGNESLGYALTKEIRYQSVEEMTAKLMMSRPDLIHVHAEPADLVTCAWHARPRTPIVFDVHDCILLRSGKNVREERLAFERADALIWPSPAFGRTVERFHPKRVKHKPQLTVYPGLADWMFPPPQKLFMIPALVYEGGSVAKEQVGGVTYRDFRTLVLQLNEQRIPMFIYPAGKDGGRHMWDVGGLTMPTLPYEQLLKQLGRFAYGVVAPGVFPDPYMRLCMPNKFFEYLAARIPVVTWGCNEVSKVVREHRCGVVLDHPKQLDRRMWEKMLRDRPKYLAGVSECNKRYGMRAQTQRILDLYDAARKFKAER